MKKASYKILPNPATTIGDVNAMLDAIDANGGYCPCQIKIGEGVIRLYSRALAAANYAIDKARFNLPTT